jgi:predicted  nucleic acid-binding Zn-ribbon protein
MHPDLQQLLQLQTLDLSIDRMRRRIAEIPSAQAALDALVAERTAGVEAVKARIAACQAARREVEKDLAAVQGRLSKYKDQLMAVKTNKEYQAMQKEISVAEEEVSSQETRLLERMEEADGLAIELKSAETALRAGEGEAAAERRKLDEERTVLEAELRRTSAERATAAAALSRDALAIFERVSAQRKGVAMAEARDGLCTACHVRLRPQVFNDVRRNDSVIQCESCNRILYYVPAAPAGSASQAS